MFDLWAGPIWFSDFDTGFPNTGIDVIDNDAIINQLNYEMGHMYTNYYEFESHDMPVWFDKETQKAEKPKMMELLAQLKARLDEVNDGSFYLDDRITSQYKKV